MQSATFAHALEEVHKPPSEELLHSMRTRLEFLRMRYPHSVGSVAECLEGLSAENSPTLLKILVAAYVINGGVLLKHGATIREQEEEEEDFQELIRQIDRFSTEEGNAGAGQGEHAPLHAQESQQEEGTDVDPDQSFEGRERA